MLASFTILHLRCSKANAFLPDATSLRALEKPGLTKRQAGYITCRSDASVPHVVKEEELLPDTSPVLVMA